jgi:hypothetical protein
VADKLSDQEKVQIRDLLGYPNVSSVATFALGLPATTETAFIIEKAMDLIPPDALPLVRAHAARLAAIDNQAMDDLELLAINQLGDIQVRADEQQMLDNRRRYWRGRLCNAMGVIPNPFDQSEAASGSVGNVRVR